MMMNSTGRLSILRQRFKRGHSKIETVSKGEIEDKAVEIQDKLNKDKDKSNRSEENVLQILENSEKYYGVVDKFVKSLNSENEKEYRIYRKAWSFFFRPKAIESELPDILLSDADKFYLDCEKEAEKSLRNIIINSENDPSLHSMEHDDELSEE